MLFGGENAESYYDEGLTAAMKGDFEKAVAHFQKATTLDGAFAAAWYQLGRCWLRLGRVPEAVSQVLPVERAIQKEDPRRQGVREAGFRWIEDALARGAEAAERDAECV